MFKLQKKDDDEDPDTRAYRLEIEKQKAIREKILRDKEMRRKQAAEENKKTAKPSVSVGGFRILSQNR